ncbi:Ger(x)C family spore germination protein [Ammoniphilus resinae]|uniref:Spore germination protein n=1 Tax=Ammoniphilus resinae TaxID=861532 RepID=A0ABS4GLF9_9BACL|nr:Ger(x)C family spore germination protein [Ammoniphilus resinae]MBP1931081.1 spore germination protein [Ammoniphilus resinae]
MKRRIGAAGLSLFISATLVITGCAQQKILDKMGLSVVIGYDRVDKDRLLGTNVLHQFDPMASESVQIVASTAYTSKGTRDKSNLEMAKKAVSGQLRVTLYSEQLAKEGIINLVDTLARDPTIGARVFLAISKGRAHDILKHRYPEFGNIGTYMYQTISQNIEGESMISPTLHDFMHDYSSVGRDTILPYLEQRGKEGNELVISGAALFQQDRMVGVIPTKEVFYVKLLRDRFQAGSIEISIPREVLGKYMKVSQKKRGNDPIFLVLDTLSSSSTFKLVDKNRPQINTEIKITGRLQEVSEVVDLSKPEIIHKIEKAISQAMMNEGNKVIAKLQKLETDPIGFGEIYRSSVRHSNLTRDKWYEMYRDAKLNLKVEMTLVRTGVIE